jgi:PPE-repeat protein
MDFASLPPEINSARIYAGPGSGPLLAAAAAWDALAAELHSTASSYQSAITELGAGPWLGPSSATMAAATAPYVAWMRTTAAQAEQTANQAIAAAAAYEAAFAETVPPPVVAGNRALLMALVATNLFGQNTAAIAATEMQYAEMWAQDTGAMLGYASTSASATSLTPFSSPPQTNNPGGPANQAAAVAQSTSISAGNAQSAVASVQQTLAAVPNALTNLAGPAQAFPGFGTRDLLGLAADLSAVFVDPEIGSAGLATDSSLGITALPYDLAGFWAGIHTDSIVSGWAGIQVWPGWAAAPPTPFPVITNPGPSPVAAGLGQAHTMGRLSVPAGWAAAAPEIRPLAIALPATSVGATDASGASVGSLISQMALAGMAGRAMAGSAATAGGAGRRERIGERVGAVTPKATESPEPEPTESPKSFTGGPITSIAAELRELASLRDSGILTDEEFTEQKRRLLPH